MAASERRNKVKLLLWALGFVRGTPTQDVHHPWTKFDWGYFWGYFEIYKSKNIASMRVAEEDMKDTLAKTLGNKRLSRRFFFFSTNVSTNQGSGWKRQFVGLLVTGQLRMARV